jgi:hypothetical protein
MLREAILGYLGGQQDFEVVMLPSARRPSVEKIAERGLDALIIENSARDPPSEAAELLRALPRLTVVYVDPGGRDATLATMVLQLTRLGDVSAEALAAAIRAETAKRRDA